MKITGNWIGSYQQTWPEEAEIFPLSIQFERTWWGAVRGTVHFDQEGVLLKDQPIKGWQHFHGLSFSIDIAAYNEQLAEAREKVAADAEDERLVDVQVGANMASILNFIPPEAPAPTLPSHFWASRIASQDELGGEWKTLVWCMVGPGQKKAQVMFAGGSWTASRVQEDR